MPLLGFQLSGDSRSGAPHGWKHFELDRMHHLRVLDRRFAGTRADSAQHRHFRLRPSLRLGTEVRTVSRTPEPEDSRVSRFEVALRPTNDAGREERLRCDFVAVCNGVFSQARVPAIDGRQRFAGRVLHSSELTDVLMLEGQRIVVVGAGKSALDCAAWAAQHCRACTLVYRAPHWMVPRYFYDVAGWA
jgi:cation diffusion facilitator CzcD-associated flavoprotein CzcO